MNLDIRKNNLIVNEGIIEDRMYVLPIERHANLVPFIVDGLNSKYPESYIFVTTTSEFIRGLNVHSINVHIRVFHSLVAYRVALMKYGLENYDRGSEWDSCLGRMLN